MDWHLWLIVGVILFIVEIIIPAFVLASFGIGCLTSAFSALLSFGLKVQILAFIVGTLVAFFGIRPFFTRFVYKESPESKTNVDALIGKTGRVLETISDEFNSGRVLVGGDDWKAIAEDGKVIEKNSKVEVMKVDGTKVYVRRI